MSLQKDIQYYATKISQCRNYAEVVKYSKKIVSLNKDELRLEQGKSSTKEASYYINKLLTIQRKNEESRVKRHALFPILDVKAYEFYQKQENIHWSATEMNFLADVPHYDAASPQVKKIIDTILAFFLSGDGAISENLLFRFLLECDTYEERAMFISQLHIELIHAETYGLAAFTFKRDAEAMAELINSVENTECIKRKLAFMEKWMLSDGPKYQRWIAFACSEGIHFCTLFAVIFWFRSQGLFPNFVVSNELIGGDESLHRDYGAYLAVKEIAKIIDEDPTQLAEIHRMIHKIITEALEAEFGFIDYILDEPLQDLNAADLKTYAQLIADNLLVQVSCPTLYNVKNPFTWLNDIIMERKGNFYEVTVAAYKKKSLAELLDWKKRVGLVKETINPYDNPEDVEF